MVNYPLTTKPPPIRCNMSMMQNTTIEHGRVKKIEEKKIGVVRQYVLWLLFYSFLYGSVTLENKTKKTDSVCKFVHHSLTHSLTRSSLVYCQNSQYQQRATDSIVSYLLYFPMRPNMVSFCYKLHTNLHILQIIQQTKLKHLCTSWYL